MKVLEMVLLVANEVVVGSLKYTNNASEGVVGCL
jgi:hypothetical protein